MEHPTLTPLERKLVSETCGRLMAQLLPEHVEQARWSLVVLAVTVELAEQVLRLRAELIDELHDTERPPPAPVEV